MSVLRYYCFRWLLCFRAYVFEPSRPLACIMMLVWLILFLELCCDIFPWVPDLDRTRLRAWLVYGQIRGATSWYQSGLPVGISFHTPWPKSSLVIEKLLLTWLCGLRAHVALWVVLGSFTPHPYSGTLISLLFRLNGFANYNFRFS